MRSAVTEDKALLGSNLSAGDGPKLAGVVFGLPLPVKPLPCRPLQRRPTGGRVIFSVNEVGFAWQMQTCLTGEVRGSKRKEL